MDAIRPNTLWAGEPFRRRTAIMITTRFIRIRNGCAAGLLLVALTGTAWPQSHALPSGDVPAIYKRLLPQIEAIKIFDHHAHPGFGDDPDVDAQATRLNTSPTARGRPIPRLSWR